MIKKIIDSKTVDFLNSFTVLLEYLFIPDTPDKIFLDNKLAFYDYSTH